jgi:hypothetical protein
MFSPCVSARKRIMLLGGSTAFGTGLNSDAERFGNRLGELLNVEVLNAAAIGYGSGQSWHTC